MNGPLFFDLTIQMPLACCLTSRLMGAQPLTVVMRALRSYTAVGLNQLLGEIGNYVDHLVEIRDERMPENGVANDVLERWANTSICLTLGLP